MKKLFTGVVLGLFFLMTPSAFAQTQIDSLKTVENPLNTERNLQFGLGFGLNFVGGTNVSGTRLFFWELDIN